MTTENLVLPTTDVLAGIGLVGMLITTATILHLFIYVHARATGPKRGYTICICALTVAMVVETILLFYVVQHGLAYLG